VQASIENQLENLPAWKEWRHYRHRLEEAAEASFFPEPRTGIFSKIG
jgi:hypothetical protein